MKKGNVKPSSDFMLETNMRLSKVEADLADVKHNMVRKDYLKTSLDNFRKDLTKDLKKAAQFDLVSTVFSSWKFWVIFLIFVGALLGTRYLDFIMGLAR